MCDTIISMPENNEEKDVAYFGKNSDREPGEIQVVEYYPHDERKGSIRATYTEVEYNGDVNAVVISRPIWMWGAEMGFNEFGVAIGNEAIFTKRKFGRTGLLGMDLLRLALEQGKTAKDAIESIRDYLERYGQGGSNSHTRNEYYDNLFLIADYENAYTVETIDREIFISKIDRLGSISNYPVDSSDVSVQNRKAHKLNMIYTMFGHGKERASQTNKLLSDFSGKVNPEYMMKILRSHRENNFSPHRGTNFDICMHAGRLTRRFQTANSMIVEIRKKSVMAWSTFSPNPCISLYKPLLIQPYQIGLSYDEKYWIKAEEIHRKLEFLNPARYQKCMDLTNHRQEEILNLVDLWKKNFQGNDRGLNELFAKIRSIDEDHISDLSRFCSI